MSRTTLTKAEPIVARSTVYSSYTKSTTGDVLYPHNTANVVTLANTSASVTTKDPDWKVLVQKRRNASGVYFRRRIKFFPKATQMSIKYYWSGPAAWYTESGTKTFQTDPKPYVIEQDDTTLRDLALGRLKKKLSTRSNQMNALIPIVELREFRKLIVALTFSLHDLFTALLTLKVKKLHLGTVAVAQLAGHLWLNWSFAIKPTLSDIEQLGKTIGAILNDPGGKHFTDYGAAKKLWTSKVDLGSDSALYGTNCKIFAELRHKLSYRYTCGYSTLLRSGNNYSVLDDIGFNLGSLPSALWELTAFSWLADYFATIGPFLEDAFTGDPVSTTYVVCTKRYTCEGQYIVGVPETGNQTAYARSSYIGSKFIWDVTDRTVLSNLPVRALRFKSSDEIAKNAMNKLANLGSILVGGRAHSNRF